MMIFYEVNKTVWTYLCLTAVIIVWIDTLGIVTLKYRVTAGQFISLKH